jgi:hypothetical protein
MKFVPTSAQELRAMFNHSVLSRDDVVSQVVASGEASPHSNQPPGTLSQTVMYYGPEGIIAEAHQFLLKDGTIGASGLPDPKMVLVDDEWLVLDRRM